jgi:urease accessory protein UreH
MLSLPWLMADPRNYYAQETLKDGTPVTIRAIRKDDKEGIHNAFRALDREAVYRRFFALKQDLTEDELEQVTDVDFSQLVALVATVSQADGEEIVVGDGRYVAAKKEKPPPSCATQIDDLPLIRTLLS